MRIAAIIGMLASLAALQDRESAVEANGILGTWLTTDVKA
jgi:hypothetical protein